VVIWPWGSSQVVSSMAAWHCESASMLPRIPYPILVSNTLHMEVGFSDSGCYFGNMWVDYRRPDSFPVPWSPLNKGLVHRDTLVLIYGAPCGLPSSQPSLYLIVLSLKSQLQLSGSKLTTSLRSRIYP